MGQFNSTPTGSWFGGGLSSHSGGARNEFSAPKRFSPKGSFPILKVSANEMKEMSNKGLCY